MIREKLHESAVAALPPVPWWEGAGEEIVEALRLEGNGARQPSIATVDVAIIGGGIAGLSAAAQAARCGAKVLLLERGHMLGMGASGQNAGIVCIGANMPLTEVLSNAEASALWHDTAVAAQELFDAGQGKGMLRARKTGSLFLAQNRTAAARMKREARARKDIGMRAELISAAEAGKLGHGRLDLSAVHCALLLLDEGRAHPLSLLAHLANDARKAGATLIGSAAVFSCEEHKNGSRSDGWQIQLQDSTVINARCLIRCVGPIASANSRIYALAFRADLPEDFPVFQDASPYTYYDYRCGDGFVTVSGGRYGKAGNSKPDHGYHQRMAQAARHWLPELQGQEPQYKWAVDLKVAADMVPEIVKLSNTAPAVAVQGLGALGVLPGIVLGRRAAKDMVAMLKP